VRNRVGFMRLFRLLLMQSGGMADFSSLGGLSVTGGTPADLSSADRPAQPRSRARPGRSRRTAGPS